MKTAQKPSQRGFTLIELLVSISIIAILATIGVVAFTGAQKGARDAKRKADVADIKKALYLYRSAAGTFCVKGAGLCTTAFSGSVSDAVAGWTGSGGATASLTSVAQYIKAGKVCDPSNSACTTSAGGYTGDYLVTITSDDQFTVQATLEGTPPTTLECAATSPRNFCI